MNSKQKYIEQAPLLKGLHLFNQPWWLNAVTYDWDVIIVEENNEIIAAWPFEIDNKAFFKRSRMPKFTQKLGPWIKEDLFKEASSKLSIEKKILNQLIKQLPKFHWFEQSFDFKLTNWLPFYWNSFQQTTKYTYRIDNISDAEEVKKNFDRSKIKNLKRASENLDVRFDLSASDFYLHHKNCLLKEGQRIRYTFDEFQRIYNAAYANKQGCTIYAIDSNNIIHSTFFFLWDRADGYNLISSIDPGYRNSGSSSLLIAEIIKYLSTKAKSLDLCGSMIEGVEQSFRRFGAQQYPYLKISKFNSKLVNLYLFLTNRMRQY